MITLRFRAPRIGSYLLGAHRSPKHSQTYREEPSRARFAMLQCALKPLHGDRGSTNRHALQRIVMRMHNMLISA
jgi:hypothetical protein